MFEYKLIRSTRKTLAIQVGTDGSVTVRAPQRLSIKEIERFLAQRESWVEKTVAAQLERSAAQKVYSPEETAELRRKAKEIIPPKVNYYAAVMGVNPTGIHITSAKRRYGSCSSKNSLNFSLYLADKDEKAVDYVVVHELAHILQHNHSKAFYDVVKFVLPDYKEREKLLK